jgi:hypothetical protein
MAYIQRTGQDTILRSEKSPVVKIQIDPEFKYAGSTSFILYDVARVEQHHFVVADAQRRVVRLLWFQFEGYLENNEHRYRYPPMETIIINGFTFLHDGDVWNIDEDYAERPTSDSAHVVDYLRQHGYTLADSAMFKRLVWLDEDLRNELMIIYAEALDPTGDHLPDVAEGGPASTDRAAWFRALGERSLSSFKIL